MNTHSWKQKQEGSGQAGRQRTWRSAKNPAPPRLSCRPRSADDRERTAEAVGVDLRRERDPLVVDRGRALNPHDGRTAPHEARRDDGGLRVGVPAAQVRVLQGDDHRLRGSTVQDRPGVVEEVTKTVDVGDVEVVDLHGRGGHVPHSFL